MAYITLREQARSILLSIKNEDGPSNVARALDVHHQALQAGLTYDVITDIMKEEDAEKPIMGGVKRYSN